MNLNNIDENLNDKIDENLNDKIDENLNDNIHENLDDNIDDKDNYNIGIFDPDGKNLNPLNSKPYSNEYKNLAKFWSGLPAYQMGKQIVETIKSNDIILIKSSTGSGKTILTPRFCLHVNKYKGRIIITLPKKIITKKAAEFAAKTLDIELGEHVGYQFRGDNLKSSKTILLYSTDGSVISMLKSDPMLKSIDMIIIDEAHERKVNIDLLLYLLKNAIKLRTKSELKPLKLIIMSATINEELFKAYYKNFRFEWLELSGTPNHIIESIYLENSIDIKSNQYLIKCKEIIGKIINKLNNNDPKYIKGDILFFVCTVSECNLISEELSKLYPDCFTMGLYSGFNTELEQYISSPNKFKELNKAYKRRLFISTNVAESSLTIDGIVYVIDSGLEINVKFDPIYNTNIMSKNFITQAQMIQRKGRAGRTKPGVCYHLYTQKEQDLTNKFPIPEIKCIDLKNTCLSLMKMCSDIKNNSLNNENKKNKENNENNEINKYKKYKYCNIENTIDMFFNFIEPPEEKFITNGFKFAIFNDLVGDNNKLTKIGRLVLESRLDVMDGLSLVYAFNISKNVFKDVFKIICICSFLKSGIDNLFYTDIDKKVKKKIISKLIVKSDNSEHILLFNLLKYIEKNKNSGLFNIELLELILLTYSRQIEKLDYVYSKFNIKLNDILNTDTNSNIINSFSFGYKSNRAFKTSKGFKYNDKLVDLSKCVINFSNSINSIIFYSNLYWSNKLNLIICSPYLL
jgi:HrpA-like RNA helicase